MTGFKYQRDLFYHDSIDAKGHKDYPFYLIANLQMKMKIKVKMRKRWTTFATFHHQSTTQRHPNYNF